MLNGLDILIERMQTHPHEFVREGKWTEILVAVDKHLSEEERQSLKQGFADMARGLFNEAVLKGIAGEPVGYDMVEIIQHDYDSAMSYPMEKRRMYEEEQKQKREAELEYMKKQMYAQQLGAHRGQGAWNSQGMTGGIF